MHDTPVKTWTSEETDKLFEQMQWSVDAINDLINGTRITNSEEHRKDAVHRNVTHLTLGQEQEWYINDDRDKSAIESAITAGQSFLT